MLVVVTHLLSFFHEDTKVTDKALSNYVIFDDCKKIQKMVSGGNTSFSFEFHSDVKRNNTDVCIIATIGGKWLPLLNTFWYRFFTLSDKSSANKIAFNAF